MAAMAPPLPPKEANQFKLVVKSYESKQYKKALKAADAILKKFPDHGETLAMKGLTLNNMERKSEAYELVRRGLKNDLKSHVCWHVYGLLYRSDREYREAIKCYLNALRIDPENNQILRDLSLLQVQMRNRAGFVETRRQLMTLKVSNRSNWIAFAIAQHINENPTMAVSVLKAYESTLDEDYPPPSEKYEHSEMLLYKAMLLEEGGQLEEALGVLAKEEPLIVDKLALREQRGALLLRLHRPAEAEKVYRGLLMLNPDNYEYFAGLQSCLGLQPGPDGGYSAGKVEKLVPLYEELRRAFPKSSAIKRLPLDFLDGGALETAVDAYVRPMLRKGVLSVYSDLKVLYAHPGKADVLERVFERLEASLKSSGSFPPLEGEGDEPKEEGPHVLAWTLYLLAQHYCRRRQHEKALAKVAEVLEHTPTMVDALMVKGRILKHAGDFQASASAANEAREMDLADRYLNSECVKRQLRADLVERAEKTAALFTKDGEQHDNLFEMQAMWYELASGDSCLRQKRYGKALKKYLAVHKHYNDMVEDQFDFHTYCMRKMTLRAYVKMLRYEDSLHAHRSFCRGAQGTIRCYLALYDEPPTATEEEEENDVAGMSPGDRKKLRQKRRKAEARAKKEAEEKAKDEEEKAAAAAAAASPAPAGKGGKKGAERAAAKPADPDPDGAQLAHVADPLAEAVKYLELLQEHAPQQLATHVLAFDVHFRRSKLLLALQALKRQLRLEPDSPDVHRCLIRYFHTVDALEAPQDEQARLVQTVIAAERADIEALAEGRTLLQVNEAFLEEHSTGSLLHRASAGEMLCLLAPREAERAVEILEDARPPLASPGQTVAEGCLLWSLEDCIQVHRLLEGPLDDKDAALRWSEKCRVLFPFSEYFEGPKCSGVVGLTPPASPALANGDIVEVSRDVASLSLHTVANGDVAS